MNLYSLIIYVTKIIKIQIKNVQNWSEKFTIGRKENTKKKKKNEKKAYLKLSNYYIKINYNKFIIDDNYKNYDN